MGSHMWGENPKCPHCRRTYLKLSSLSFMYMACAKVAFRKNFKTLKKIKVGEDKVDIKRVFFQSKLSSLAKKKFKPLWYSFFVSILVYQKPFEPLPHSLLILFITELYLIFKCLCVLFYKKYSMKHCNPGAGDQNWGFTKARRVCYTHPPKVVFFYLLKNCSSAVIH